MVLGGRIGARVFRKRRVALRTRHPRIAQRYGQCWKWRCFSIKRVKASYSYLEVACTYNCSGLSWSRSIAAVVHTVGLFGFCPPLSLVQMTLDRVLVFVAVSWRSVGTVVGQPFPPDSTANNVDAISTTPRPSTLCDLTGVWSGNWPADYTGPTGLGTSTGADRTSGPVISVRRAVTNVGVPAAQYMAGGGVCLCS